MIGKALQVGDHTTDENGNPILVVGIASVNVEGEQIIIEGYGLPREY